MTSRETFEERNSNSAHKGNSPRVITVVSVLLAVFVTLSLGAALQKSPTADENFHLVAGYSYLKWGDFRINPEHPPLVKLLAALPLLTLDIDDTPLTRERRDQVQVNGKYGWRLANQWLFSSNDADRLFFYAKLPMVALGAFLGLLVFCWARQLYGLTAAFVALAVYVLDPNILAHSAVIHTDVPSALAIFGGTYFYWRTLKEITWFNWLMTAVFFSMSAVTKFSFLTILPVWGLLGTSIIFSSDPLRPRFCSNSVITGYRGKAACLTIIFFLAAALALLAIWATYGFRYESAAGQRDALVVAASIEPSLWLRPLLRVNPDYHFIPEAWLTGLVYALSTFNRTAYLLGEISGEGFWLYFPIAFAVKTPLPTLVLLIVALVMYLPKTKRSRDEGFLFIPILLFFFFAIYARMNIGLRHMLVIYPFLFVWIGASVAALWHSRSIIKRCGVMVVGIWLLGSTLNAYPDYLAYFNDAIEPSVAHEILVDSNLDWGQDLKGLKQWMDRKGVRKIPLAYFGTADPAYYGIEAVHKPGTWSTVLSNPGNNDDTTVSPFIAISATHLVGVYLGPRNPYAEFLRKEPVAIIGRSIFIYRTDQP